MRYSRRNFERGRELNDWETFSANPYQQAEPTAGRSPEAVAALMISPALLLDWPDQLLVINALLLGGKKAIWIDLLAAGEAGLSGKDIQDGLNSQGIEIHANALYPIEETIAAIIMVDAENEARARKALARMGVPLLL